MHKLLLTALLSTVAIPALAADLPGKARPAPPAVVADWTGFYLGIHGGYGWGKIEFDDLALDTSPKDWVFGGHAGYNWQSGAFVGGFEIDYSAANLKESLFDGDVTSKIDALASARGRAGFLLTNNLLAYGTAGIGWGHSKITFVSDETVSETNHFGWVAGGGLEWKLTPNLLLRGEYLHYDFGTVSHALGRFAAENAATTVNVARGGLSLKF
jgi:opacity protein-like surface antigen